MRGLEITGEDSLSTIAVCQDAASRRREWKGLASQLARNLAVHPGFEQPRRELGFSSHALEPHSLQTLLARCF
jgi:hypothetical protein